MNLSNALTAAKKMLGENSPVILTALGVTGTVTTAYLAVRGAFKAHQVLLEEDARRTAGRKGEEVPVLTSREIFGLTWKFYVPAVASGVMTCTCIIGANYIGTKRASALAAAYALSDKAISEYKSKVVERIGEQEETAIRQELEREKKHPVSVFFADNDVLFLDAYSGRYFQCNKETLRRAANDINYQIIHSDFATLTDFWQMVGLEPTSASDEVGWNSLNPLELVFSTHETPDGKPCMSYDFAMIPIQNPWAIQDRL